MTRYVMLLIALMMIAGLTACATKSDAERCTDSGGVWKQDMCEIQAK